MNISLIYLTGIIGWLLFWWFVVKPENIKSNPLLWLPFVLCLFFLCANMIISGSDSYVSHIELEESLFHFLDARSALAIKATASVLVVATIIYGVSVKKLPELFIILESYAFIALIGLMAPITWIPTNAPEMLMPLRHMQTIPFLWGLFLAVAGIVVLLKDVKKVFSENTATEDSEPKN